MGVCVVLWQVLLWGLWRGWGVVLCADIGRGMKGGYDGVDNVLVSVGRCQCRGFASSLSGELIWVMWVGLRVAMAC